MNMMKIIELANEIDLNIEDELNDKLTQLISLSKQRKEIEKQEKALKSLFKEEIGAGASMSNESGMVVVFEKSRESLNRKSLEDHFGKEMIDQFVKTTTFLQIDVKPSK